MAESVLIFGDSGLGKTINLGFAAKYLYEQTGGRTGRYIDAGGNPKPIEPLAELGVIEVLSVMGAKFPCTMLRKLSVGFWPTPDGHKKLRDGVPLRVEDWLAPSPEVWKRVGFYLNDPMGGMADILLEDLREHGRIIGEGVVGEWKETSKETGMPGDEKFCNNSRAHYGWVQRETTSLVRQFNSLPVDRVIWTSHESKGEEEDTKRTVRGPSIVGKAATDSILKHFGTVIHFEGVARKDNSGAVVLCYFRPHPDQIGAIYKCKPRTPAELDGELTKRWPKGFFVPQTTADDPNRGTLADYMRLEDELVGRATGLDRDWKAQVDERVATLRALAGEKK